MNRSDRVLDRPNLHAPVARHGAVRHERNDGDAESGLDHADHGFGARRFQRDGRRKTVLVKGVEHVLAAGRSLFVKNQRMLGDLLQPRLPGAASGCFRGAMRLQFIANNSE